MVSASRTQRVVYAAMFPPFGGKVRHIGVRSEKINTFFVGDREFSVPFGLKVAFCWLEAECSPRLKTEHILVGGNAKLVVSEETKGVNFGAGRRVVFSVFTRICCRDFWRPLRMQLFGRLFAREIWIVFVWKNLNV